MLIVQRVGAYETRLPQGQGNAGLGKKCLMPALKVKHVLFEQHHAQSDVCRRAFEASKPRVKHVMVYQVVTCQFCGFMHIDKGKYKLFNHISHKC